MRWNNDVAVLSDDESIRSRLWQQAKDYFLDINRFSVHTVVSEDTADSCGGSSNTLGSSESIGII